MDSFVSVLLLPRSASTSCPYVTFCIFFLQHPLHPCVIHQDDKLWRETEDKVCCMYGCLMTSTYIIRGKDCSFNLCLHWHITHIKFIVKFYPLRPHTTIHCSPKLFARHKIAAATTLLTLQKSSRKQLQWVTWNQN